MGKVIVRIRVTNYNDLMRREDGLLAADPRSAEVDALVDTGAMRLYLQRGVVRALGLGKSGETTSRTTNGICRRDVYRPVELELMGRSGPFDVVEVDDDVPNLVGLIPLEYLDFVVDPLGQRLIPNPEHGGQHMTDEFRAV